MLAIDEQRFWRIYHHYRADPSPGVCWKDAAAPLAGSM
jgi:hypothetical protein